MSIPKTIHQTWKTSEVPDKWKKSPEEWKRLHPGWTYKLWTDEDNRNLIEQKYPWFLPMFDSYKYPIQRADAVRYFILHSEGGVYSDLDLYPVAPIDPYVSGGEEAYFVSSPSTSTCFTNAFMASKPGASIWDKVFDKLSSNHTAFWHFLSKHFHIMTTTGPMMLDSVIRLEACNTLGYLPRVRFSAHDFNEKHSCNDGENSKPYAILIPLPGSSWCGLDSHIFNFINQHKSGLAIIGILLIIIIIIVMIVYIFRYIKYRNKFNVCSRGLK